MTQQGRFAVVVATVLLAAVATLALAFLHTVDAAAHHFDRAALSQAQFSDVLAIRAAAQAGDAGAVAGAVARYRAAILAEADMVEGADQRQELADASAMVRYASSSTRRLDALAHVVETAMMRERDETRQVASAMAELRRRARLYAILLATVAAAAAAIGAAGLLQANRRLAGAVDDRTRRLIAVDASRRLFFAKISHELRTPVTVMRGEAEVALASARGEAAPLAAALGEVVVQSEQLDRRIAELLALSQAEDGRLVLAEVSFDLAATVGRAVDRSHRHAASNGIRLVCDVLAPARVRGDPRWIEQALVAVIDNAVKFSAEDGQVDITLTTDHDVAAVRIDDRGIGALPDALPRLFDAYYQTDEGRARGGSGLGLALVRWVAERHGGDARAAARAGGGCAVTITLPIAA